MITKILNWINWVKKGAVASIVMTIVAYCAAKNYIGAEEVTLLGWLCTIIFGAASYEWQIKVLKDNQSTDSI